MGDINQRLFLQARLPAAAGAILEVGSKDYGSTTSFRDLYPGCRYVGLDLEEGKGVDVIINLENGIGELEPASFDLIICCSVLEHTPRPWVVSGNLTKLLRPGGLIYVSVPWVWRYHAYPDDYFRFSFKSLPSLFPELAWEDPVYSTTVPGEFVPVSAVNSGVDNNMAVFANLPNGQKRKYLPYLMVNAIGRKQG